ncbi:DNA-processing protein DprA [Azohydromonas caseinilytica]|uniref:DNA-protecting protein DprA n=1 Tax=Azohydromonas caseinilytica TaxID=2728836 RepID=A0A848F2P1_9BURK|nr:DNA-processing protein DprA [Azohydromonas caseinilytica]NML13672.1 DNA-protecting protein DprA [Azohydromonas caseinilytica]
MPAPDTAQAFTDATLSGDHLFPRAGADELRAWLRLVLSVGRATGRRLLGALGTPQQVFDSPLGMLRELVTPTQLQALAAPPGELENCLTQTLNWLDGGADRQVVTLGDPLYPAALLNAADPPLLLHLRGRHDLLTRPGLAVVGSRNPSAQGTDNATAFARCLSEAGWTIVSGLALGIDGAAHEGGLAGPGRTIAVLGTGIDRLYPARHRDLALRIAAEGLLVSEFPLGTPPLRENFPQRNRLIAGLTRGTLVVEAALQSGSLITARLAAENGREVFAIPGSIHAPQSRGCHALIKQGAKLVESAQDILEEFQMTKENGPLTRTGTSPRRLAAMSNSGTEPAADDGPPDEVLTALGHDAATLDMLIDRTGWPAPALAARLLELELEGRLQRLPGGLYQRRGLA